MSERRKKGRRLRGRKAMAATPATMIRSLRLKFVVASMTAITLVVAATFATICYLDYRQSVNEVYEQLQLATDSAFGFGRGHGWGRWNKGLFPYGWEDQSAGAGALGGGPSDDGDGQESTGSGAGDESDSRAPLADDPMEHANGAGGGTSDQDAAAPNAPLQPDSGDIDGDRASGNQVPDGQSDESPGEDDEDFALPPQIGGGRHEGASIPVAVFFVDSAAENALSLSGSTASLSTAVLGEALSELSADGVLSSSASSAAGVSAVPSSDRDADRGLLSSLGLFYLVRPVESGFMVAFADASNASSWENLAALLAVVGALVLAVFLVASIFFARWALRPVERAWNQQQQFIADASHELKTPLTVILANTSILKSRPQETVADQAQWVESTQVEAERMQGLVNDMLDLARPQQAPGLGAGAAAQAGEAPTPVDVSDLVEGEVLQFEAVAFERGIQLDSRVEEGLEVQGSADRLKRLTAILLDNACKYAEPAPDGALQALPGAMSADGLSDESGPLAEDGLAEEDGLHGEDDVRASGASGGSRACIQVTLEKEGRDARLTVANTGPAIPEEDLTHLFDRFYRVDKSRTKQAPSNAMAPEPQQPGGFGLGLAIARDIVQAHGGTIAVESTAEAGTVFTVELPLA